MLYLSVLKTSTEELILADGLFWGLTTVLERSVRGLWPYSPTSLTLKCNILLKFKNSLKISATLSKTLSKGKHCAQINCDANEAFYLNITIL